MLQPKRLLVTTLLVSIYSMLVACGGSSDSESSGGSGNLDEEPGNPATVNTEFGYLIDAPVEGLNYEAGEVFGTTDSSGRFRFIPHEPVAFSYAGMALGTVTLDEANSIVTPVELQGISAQAAASDVATVNLLRLLQTLDTDSDPGNGIRLIEPSMLEEFGLQDLLGGVQLADANFDAQLQSALDELDGELGTTLNIVSEEDALAHFGQSLELLAIPETFIEYSGADQWYWDIYTTPHGEWAARVRFDSDGSGVMEEFAGCTAGSGNADSWVGTYERANAACSQRHSEDITWTMEGKTLEISTDTFTDSCQILSGTVNRAKGSCRIYQGQDRYAIETQYFVRTNVDGFYPKLLTEVFYEFNRQGEHALGEYSLLDYRNDGSASYQIPREGPDETGSFDWSIINDQQTIVYGDIENPDEETSFIRYLAGAYEVDYGSGRIMIPHYSGVKMAAGQAHRYSADDGQLLSPSSEMTEFVWRCPNTVTGELCYSAESETSYREYACQPIYNFPTDNGDSVYWMHCGVLTGDAPSSYQIWRLRGE